MWDMWPDRFIALLEHLLTDGMDEEERAEWETEMCAEEPAVDVDDPMLNDLVAMRQAATIEEAAELMRLGQQLGNTSNPDKQAKIQQRMRDINARAMEAAAAAQFT